MTKTGLTVKRTNTKVEVIDMAVTTRTWEVEEIKELVLTNDLALYGALKELYKRQTDDEKESRETKDHNGVGFTAYDAEFMTSITEFLIKNGFLTPKQKAVARKKIVKYSKQLTKIANKQI